MNNERHPVAAFIDILFYTTKGPDNAMAIIGYYILYDGFRSIVTGEHDQRFS
jgi:hypothetical protein